MFSNIFLGILNLSWTARSFFQSLYMVLILNLWNNEFKTFWEIKIWMICDLFLWMEVLLILINTILSWSLLTKYSGEVIDLG